MCERASSHPAASARRIARLGGSLLLLACDAGDRSAPSAATAPSLPTAPTQPVQSAEPTATRVELAGETGDGLVGRPRILMVFAYAADGRPVRSDDVDLSSSDPAVSTVARRTTVPVRDLTRGTTTNAVRLEFAEGKAGEATITATVGAASAQLRVRVIDVPNVATPMVVDSFVVVEYKDICAWDCPYIVYAPLLKLRNPTAQRLTVELVSFSMPGHESGWCSAGGIDYAPGERAHLNGIDPYLWANDLIFVHLDGSRAPPGPVTARIIVRGADGSRGTLETTGRIHRVAEGPVALPPARAGIGWWCG